MLQTDQEMMEPDKILPGDVVNDKEKITNSLIFHSLLLSSPFLVLYFSPSPLSLSILLYYFSSLLSNVPLILFTFPYYALEENIRKDILSMSLCKNE